MRRISDTTLTRWVRADRDARSRAEDPDGLSESERVELARLHKENAGLRLNRETLRKAAAYVGDRCQAGDEFSLAFGSGVVALASEGGFELDGGDENGLDCRLEGSGSRSRRRGAPSLDRCRRDASRHPNL